MSTIGYYICVPFAWLVRLFYNLTSSYGVALILFTLVIKLIMLPFQMKSKKSMMRMSRCQRSDAGAPEAAMPTTRPSCRRRCRSSTRRKASIP